MNLPFEKEDRGARKWQCFVCGCVQPDYETFKTHIVDTHELGREYVVCPLERCKCPVRDVKAHFKAKHPTEKYVARGPAKAIVWKDVSNTGKTKTRKPSFRSGTMYSNKNWKEMPYKSGLECEFYEILEALSEVVKYDVEPFHIPYLYDGQMHKYYPDLSVQFNDGHCEIWEIKPGSQTGLPVNEAKWKAAKQFCEARGLDFIVMTEVGFNKLKKKVQRRSK